MKRGIISAGNFIIDHVKTISYWPKRGMLADILDEKIGSGGGAYNNLIDLAKMDTQIPLYAVGMIGHDKDGDYIIDDLESHGISTKYMNRTSEAPTSYTDVMTEKGSEYRTFFHCRGANALLTDHHFEGIQCEARIFYLGYLLLLDSLDSHDDHFGVKAARVLKKMSEKGFETAVDLVSVESERTVEIVISCLPHIDYLIINEIEASNVTGFPIRRSDQAIDAGNLERAAGRLIKEGVRSLVTIHFPEGAFGLQTDGKSAFVPSFKISSEEIKGTTGAGDAFCAGMLYCLHEKKSLEYALKFANASARFNLTHETATGGAAQLEQIEAFMMKGVQKNF